MPGLHWLVVALPPPAPPLTYSSRHVRKMRFPDNLSPLLTSSLTNLDFGEIGFAGRDQPHRTASATAATSLWLGARDVASLTISAVGFDESIGAKLESTPSSRNDNAAAGTANSAVASTAFMATSRTTRTANIYARKGVIAYRRWRPRRHIGNT